MEGGFSLDYVLSSPLKVNLTLRITGRNENGFHELQSVFLRIRGPETLLVRIPSATAKDRITVYNCVIKNENIIDKALKHLREAKLLPSTVEIELFKAIPPGTGLGAGSGNAAALVEWAKRSFGRHGGMHGFEKEIGADVPFLCGTSDISRVGGIGETLEPLPANCRFCGFVLIPAWRSDTAQAYREIDRKFAGRWMSEKNAIEEIKTLLSSLESGEKIGLLPNDFLTVLLEKHDEYRGIFALAEKTGALAWGLSGSGSAVFALFPAGESGKGRCEILAHTRGIERIYYWE